MNFTIIDREKEVSSFNSIYKMDLNRDFADHVYSIHVPFKITQLSVVHVQKEQMFHVPIEVDENIQDLNGNIVFINPIILSRIKNCFISFYFGGEEEQKLPIVVTIKCGYVKGVEYTQQPLRYQILPGIFIDGEHLLYTSEGGRRPRVGT